MASLEELFELEEELELRIDLLREDDTELMHLDSEYREATNKLRKVEKKIIKKLLKELKRRTVG